MFFRRLIEDETIVEIHNSVFQSDEWQYDVYGSLKRASHVSQSWRQSNIEIQPIENSKCCFSPFFSSISTWQYPLLTSNMENTAALSKESMHSTIQKSSTDSVLLKHRVSLIDTKTSCSLFSWSKHDGFCPFGSTGSIIFVPTACQHRLFETIFFSVYLWTVPDERVVCCLWDVWCTIIERLFDPGGPPTWHEVRTKLPLNRRSS